VNFNLFSHIQEVKNLRIGMLTCELARRTPQELMDAIAGYGFACVQLTLSSFYDDDVTLDFDAPMARLLGELARERGISIPAVNGTFNMAHPDKNVRSTGLKGLNRIASLCGELGCGLVTLCTGSRNDNMWEWHPDNVTQQAWNDMIQTVRDAVEIASDYGVRLGIEIEQSNIVNSVDAAVRLFREVDAPCLVIILDGANILTSGDFTPEEVMAAIKEVFAKLGGRIGLAHGKDIKKGKGISFASAGNGIVNFDYMLELLRGNGYDGPMILHGIKDETDFPRAFSFMKERIVSAGFRLD
jgi:sugar phosphate isomerase/epimerase